MPTSTKTMAPLLFILNVTRSATVTLIRHVRPSRPFKSCQPAEVCIFPGLWPFSATQQKVARSWSTQIDLMDRYPEHRFAASQAQQFKWLEQLYPQLFDKVRARVASGEFQPIGGCWVEMDTNMPSGESICRQFLFGQRFFKSRFNKLCETCSCHR